MNIHSARFGALNSLMPQPRFQAKRTALEEASEAVFNRALEISAEGGAGLTEQVRDKLRTAIEEGPDQDCYKIN